MARLDELLSEAEAALATPTELTARDALSLAERDGAILRLVYTFEAIWKSAVLLLYQREGVDVGSPKGAIRACRRSGLLTDADAEEALTLADDRNMTVHMYRHQIAEAIGGRLVPYAALLRRWLAAMRERAAAGSE